MLPNTVHEYSRHAAQEFIQTAVFIDDRIYEKNPGKSEITRELVVPKSRKRATRADDQNQVVADDETVKDSDLVDPSPDTYDIVTSFAKKQVICSLYQPKKVAKFSEQSDVFQLCRPADVVIVDWDMWGDKGGRAKELIDGLIKQAVEDVPEQLRLIIVYTQEQNLFAVANELFEKLQETLDEGFEPQNDGLSFHTSNSRLSVLGKPGRDRPDTDPTRIVEEQNLAEVAVDEFAALASGLLQAATLLGLAEIRKNSRKVLSKFGSDLDSGFLTHFALSLPLEDASTHVIPLLVAEIQAVLEDALPTPLMTNQVLDDWCDHVWVPSANVKTVLGNGNDPHAIGKAILKDGFTKAKEAHNTIPKTNGNSNTRKASTIFLSNANDLANHRFAHLMSSRTFYDQNKRTLRLGTIVRRKSDDQYLLCLQPLCDSVRITEQERVFLFVELKEPDKGQMTHVVHPVNGSPLELCLQAKSYHSATIKFKPSKGRKVVAAKKTRDGGCAFYDKSNRRYEWIDQLKIEHAQRAVTHLASDLSRVGLTESEWLRLLDRK